MVPRPKGAATRPTVKSYAKPKGEEVCLEHRKPSSKTIHNFSYLLLTVVNLVEHFLRLLEIVSPNIL